MEHDSDNYRSSDDEDYDGEGSGGDAEELEDVAVRKNNRHTGKRLRSSRKDALEEIDASEAADLRDAAREAYGSDIYVASAAKGVSSLGSTRLDELWREMNADAPKPRLVLVGSVPLSTFHGKSRSAACIPKDRASSASLVDLISRGVRPASSSHTVRYANIPSDQKAALQV